LYIAQYAPCRRCPCTCARWCGRTRCPTPSAAGGCRTSGARSEPTHGAKQSRGVSTGLVGMDTNHTAPFPN
jgi:hypothetical protein